MGISLNRATYRPIGLVVVSGPDLTATCWGRGGLRIRNLKHAKPLAWADALENDYFREALVRKQAAPVLAERPAFINTPTCNQRVFRPELIASIRPANRD